MRLESVLALVQRMKAELVRVAPALSFGFGMPTLGVDRGNIPQNAAALHCGGQDNNWALSTDGKASTLRQLIEQSCPKNAPAYFTGGDAFARAILATMAHKVALFKRAAAAQA